MPESVSVTVCGCAGVWLCGCHVTACSNLRRWGVLHSLGSLIAIMVSSRCQISSLCKSELNTLDSRVPALVLCTVLACMPSSRSCMHHLADGRPFVFFHASSTVPAPLQLSWVDSSCTKHQISLVSFTVTTAPCLMSPCNLSVCHPQVMAWMEECAYISATRLRGAAPSLPPWTALRSYSQRVLATSCTSLLRSAQSPVQAAALLQMS